MGEEFSPAVRLLSDQMSSRVEVREKFKAEFPELTDAHQLVLSALAAVITRHVAKKIEAPSADVEGQIALIAQFLTGVDLCESAIAEGLYSQGAALLKQELETVAAIEEYREGRRADGKTPRIGIGVTQGHGPVYGRLNEISHVSRHEVAKGLVTGQIGDLVGASIVSIFIADLAAFLYSQHVLYIGLVVQHADRLFTAVYGAGLNSEEREQASLAQLLLLMKGYIEIPADALGSGPDLVRSVIAERDQPKYEAATAPPATPKRPGSGS